MNPRFNVLLVTVLLVANFLQAQDKDLTIENESLVVEWSATTHQVSLVSKPSGNEFLKDIALNGTNGVATVTSATSKTFGQGRAIDILYPDGDRDSVGLFPNLPFVMLHSSLH